MIFNPEAKELLLAREYGGDTNAWRLSIAKGFSFLLGAHALVLVGPDGMPKPGERRLEAVLCSDLVRGRVGAVKARSYGWWAIKRVWWPLWRIVGGWMRATVEGLYAPGAIGYLEGVRSLVQEGLAEQKENVLKRKRE